MVCKTALIACDGAKQRVRYELTALLADTINLGLTKMTESCPGSSFHQIDTYAFEHVRNEAYSKALAELVIYQHQLPFAAHWGSGTAASSDGQPFPVGGRGEQSGNVNLRYGTSRGSVEGWRRSSGSGRCIGFYRRGAARGDGGRSSRGEPGYANDHSYVLARTLCSRRRSGFRGHGAIPHHLKRAMTRLPERTISTFSSRCYIGEGKNPLRLSV